MCAVNSLNYKWEKSGLEDREKGAFKSLWWTELIFRKQNRNEWTCKIAISDIMYKHTTDKQMYSQHWITNKLCVTFDKFHLENEAVVELGVATFALGFGLSMPPVVRQQLEPHQCGVGVATGGQVGGAQQWDHQLLPLLLVLHRKPQTHGTASRGRPLTGLLRDVVQVWPQGTQGEGSSTHKQRERS